MKNALLTLLALVQAACAVTAEWTANNSYPALMSAGPALGADSKAAEIAGDTKVVTLSDPANLASVSDTAGNTYSKQADGTWIAENIKATAWTDRTSATWNIAENHPTISVSECPASSPFSYSDTNTRNCVAK